MKFRTFSWLSIVAVVLMLGACEGGRLVLQSHTNEHFFQQQCNSTTSSRIMLAIHVQGPTSPFKTVKQRIQSQAFLDVIKASAFLKLSILMIY